MRNTGQSKDNIYYSKFTGLNYLWRKYTHQRQKSFQGHTRCGDCSTGKRSNLVISYILRGMLWFSYYLISIHSMRKNGAQLLGNNIVITIEPDAVFVARYVVSLAVMKFGSLFNNINDWVGVAMPNNCMECYTLHLDRVYLYDVVYKFITPP